MKYQIFTLLIAMIPFANILLVRAKSDNVKLCRTLNLVFPKIFCFAIIILLLLKNDKNISIEFFSFFSLSFAFSITKLSLIFLAFLGFFWLVFAIYIQKLLATSNIEKDFYEYFLLIIATLCLLFLSKNLVTLLVFYQTLVIIYHFFSSKFLYKKDGNNLISFTLLFLLQTIFLFLAIILTLKTTGKSDFDGLPLALNDLSGSKFLLLATLYFASTFLLILAPCYLFYQKIKLNSIFIFTIFFLLYAVSNCYILFKILLDVFGVFTFSFKSLRNYFIFFEGFMLFNITISSLFLLFSNNFKSSFFYFFFQQLSFALFSTLLFLIYKIEKIFLPFLSFALSFTILVFCISNIALYLENISQKKSDTFFSNTKATIILLFFTLLAIAKILPSVSLAEGFLIIKVIISEGLTLSAIICFISFSSVVIFAVKMIYLFLDYKNRQKIINANLGSLINVDSGLAFIISPLLVFLMLILSPILLIYF